MTDENLISYWVPSIEEMRDYYAKILHNIGATRINIDEYASDELKEAHQHFQKGIESIVAHLRK